MRLFVLLGVAALSLAADENPLDSGPMSLIITYRCNPSQRAQFRKSMMGSGLGLFQHWKEDGVLSEYHVLFSRYVDTDAWDAMTILRFSNYTNLQRWKKVEAVNPAGISPEMLAMTLSVNTYPVDLVRRGTDDSIPAEPVFYVVPYSQVSSYDDFVRSVDSSLKPLYEGSMKAGILFGYGVYMQRYPAARPWDSMVVLEYKSDDDFGAREKVIADLRQQMQIVNVPSAQERQAVIADELVLRR